MDKFVVVNDINIKIPFSKQSREALFLKHLRPYQFLIDFCKDKTVLDIGCGFGYGSFILSHFAKKVTGVDMDESCLQFANKEFIRENLDYVCTDVFQLDKVLNHSQFELICALEFIEHLTAPLEFLHLIKNYLSDDGMLFLTTPNRLMRSVDGLPWNPEHIQEFDKSSFQELLSKEFRSIHFQGISGSDRAIEFNRRRTGGNAPPSVKRLWRFVPEFIKKPIRRVINLSLPQDITLEDYFIEKELNEKSFTIIAFCSNAFPAK